MAFDGNGNWVSAFSAEADKAAGYKILASRFDGIFIADLATSFENCLTKDAQIKPTTNFDVNSNKIINLADPVNNTDAVNLQSLNAVDTGAVHIAGTETITGAKTFTQTLTRSGNFASGGGLGIVVGTDTNSKGDINLKAYYTSSSIYERLLANNATSGKSAYLDIKAKDDGTSEFNLGGSGTLQNHVASSSKTTGMIATIGFVNDPAKSTNVVHRDGTETITGAKTFSGAVELGASATATTPAYTDNDTSVATTAMVHNFVDTMRSNCIIAIPQDIKLELASDGTLTLKSGSVLTAPDGTQVSITEDKTRTYTTNGVSVVFASTASGNIATPVDISKIGSGASLPADGSTYTRFFNTTDRKFYTWSSGSSSWGEWAVGLPICIATVSGGKISSIDEIFNGLGYVGHHAFVLPGISVLRADGRNPDGTLKSQAVTLTTLNIIEMDTSRKVLDLSNSTTAERSANWYEVETYNDIKTNVGVAKQYVKSENNVYIANGGVITLAQRTLLARISYNGTSVTQFDVEPVIKISTSSDVTTLQNEIDTVNTAVSTLDSQVVKLSGSQTISGNNTFTGTNTVPTQTAGDSSGKIASTEFVQTAIANYASAPLNTTTIWGDGSPDMPTNINLSEPFTNFEQLAIQCGNNSGDRRHYFIVGTYWLNRVLTNASSGYVLLCGDGGIYVEIYNYNQTTPSTTTKFHVHSNNASLFSILGVNRISS